MIQHVGFDSAFGTPPARAPLASRRAAPRCGKNAVFQSLLW
jgi:hypothetical protein